MKDNQVITVCYNISRMWDSREQAQAFFTHAILCSEGSEQSRYANVLTQILDGKKLCVDEV